MPKEYFEFPPVPPEVITEIVNALPEGALRDYWEGLVAIKRMPKDDPNLAAIVAMGIMTIIVRRVPAEMATFLTEMNDLLTQPPVLTSIGGWLRDIKPICASTVLAISNVGRTAGNVEQALKEIQHRAGSQLQKEVEAAISKRSLVDRHPIAVWLLGVVPLVIGYSLGHYL